MKYWFNIAGWIYLIGFGLTGTSLSFAEELKTEYVNPHRYAFNSLYLGGGLSRTNPTGLSDNEFNEGSSASNLYYRFFMHDEWHMGVAGGFKTLFRSNDTHASFFSVSQDSYRLFRIYHPAWFGVGFKTMYLVGVEEPNLPYERDPEEPSQIGVGVGAAVFYLTTSKILLHAEIGRWRSTLTNKLHAVEFGMGISFALNSSESRTPAAEVSPSIQNAGKAKSN